MQDRRRDVGLFRYSLIREPAEPGLAARERGVLVRDLAAREHTGPGGDRALVSRSSLDRWIRAYKAGGFEALLPKARQGEPRTPKALLDLAEALKREAPKRTAAGVAEIMRRTGGQAPSVRTLQRHFARAGLNRMRDGHPPRVYGRFEASEPGDLWTGDALHGLQVGGRKTYLFAFIDDHSRLLTGYRWGCFEDTLRLEAALRSGLASRGVPRAIYVDNGSSFCSAQLLRACATLRIRLVHSRPGEPAGRGKIERVFRTIRDQFLVELTHRGCADLRDLNELFSSWVESVYHARVHTETGQSPAERFLAQGPPPLPTPGELHEAFLWSLSRRVTKTATVSLYANAYEVDPALVGTQVELVFDPFDLSDIEVRYQGRVMGKAVPFRLSRKVHPQARPEAPAQPPARTGIDYLGVVRENHFERIRRRIGYAGLGEAEQSEQTDTDHLQEDQ
jgi:putative transposase